MKAKLFISMFLALCLTSMAYSQTNKGNFVVSGSTGLQVVNTKIEGEDGFTIVTLSPSIGYFVADGLSIGADLNLVTTEGETVLSALPSATYYFDTQSQVKPFVGLGIGYSSISIDDSYYGDETFSGLALGANLGMVYLFNKNAGLNLGLQYMRNDFSDLGVQNVFGGMVGFSVFF